MFLKALLLHKKNTGVLVNGHTYHVASDLVIRYPNGQAVDVPEADAQKLLKNTAAWAVYDPTAVQPVAVLKSKERPRISLISESGEVIPPLPTVSEASTVTVADPPIPATLAEEWADPDVSYSLEWLQACAQAYNIKYRGKDKAALVEKIKTAMYG